MEGASGLCSPKLLPATTSSSPQTRVQTCSRAPFPEPEVTGTLALDGLEPVAFKAKASHAVGNLYDVKVGADLSFNGTAPDGDSFTGKLTEIRENIPEEFKTSPFSVYRADLQFATKDSKPGASIAPLYSGAVPNELYVIASDEGAALGGPKTKAGRGTFFTWRMID